MNKKTILTIAFLGGFIFLGYVGGWWDIFYKGLGKNSSAIPLSKPASVMYNSALTGWDDQELAWTIEAVKIWEASDGNQVYFEEITNGVIYTKKDGKVYFKAKTACWERYREELKISGGLEAKQDEESFTTDEAVMKYKNEELFCPSLVQYYGDDLQIIADRMTMNFKKEEVLLEGNVELIQKGDAIRSEGLIYWKKDRKFQLINPREAIIKP